MSNFRMQVLLSHCFRGIIFTWLFLVLACKEENNVEDNAKNLSVSFLKPTMAQGFEYASKDSLLILKTTNSEFLPNQLQSVKKNPKSIAVLSSTFIPYLKALGLEDRITATGESNYISDLSIRNKIESKKIHSTSTQGEIDKEWFLANKPDLVLTYKFSSHDSVVVETFKKLGLSVLVLQPFEEPHPLGRVEWIKVLGTLFNLENKADSIFTEISTRYQTLRDSVGKLPIAKKPLVLSGSPFEGIWWVPGGASLSAKLIEDAGGKYLFEEDSHKVAFATDFERILAQAQNIDFWINTNPFRKLKEFTAFDRRLENFKVIQNQGIFNHEKSKRPWGADDFYESGVFRPDWVLSDLIKIFHSNHDTNRVNEFYFYQRLN